MRLLFGKTGMLFKGNELLTSRELHIQCTAFRIWFRPRVLRDVTSVDWSTTILGQKSSLPVYIVSFIDAIFTIGLLTLLNSLPPHLVNWDTPTVN